MQIETIVVGPLKTNCYLITIGGECIIIDPGAEGEKIIKKCKEKKVVGCLVTHFHEDHIGALKNILKEYNLELNKIKSKKFLYKIIKTPGHTSDSKIFYFEKEQCMFVGDFLFKQGIGRTDLGGNEQEMKESLAKIKQYPNEITIYPGHGPSSTLGEEKNYFSFYY